MKRFAVPHSRRAVAIVAGLLLAATSAHAQGTVAEREACTSDAINLCSDTIPDVPKTTACMKAHLSQLSPRCRAVVAGRLDPSAPPRRVRREPYPSPGEAAETGGQGYAYSRPEAGERSRRRYIYGDPNIDEGESFFDGAPLDADEGGDRRYTYIAPDGQAAEVSEPSDRTRARARIGHLCDDDELDAETCALTERALRR